MVSTGMKIVKYLLFVFNFIFWVTGIAIITVGAVIMSKSAKYAVIDDKIVNVIPVVLIVAGCIVTIIAFFGCCGAIRESYCMIMSFAVFLGLIFVIELAVAIAAYVQRDKVQESVITKYLEKMLTEYDPKDEKTVKWWNIVQHDEKCCGINGFEDWNKNTHIGTGNVPDSCCIDDKIECGKNALADPNRLNRKGCLHKVYDDIKRDAVIVAGVCLGIAFVEIVGIIFACMLARAIKREYEIV